MYQQPTLIPQSNPYDEFSPKDYFALHESSTKIRSGEELAAFAETVLGKRGSVLELGCGAGELLSGAARRGWTVRGIEMTEAFAHVARARYGIEVECATVQRAKTLDDEYDLIFLAAILEHLYDPAETLKRVRNALRPGGLAFIDVPNECSMMTRIGNAYLRLRRKDWAVNLSPTFPPFHVVGFCPVSLKRLLDRTGFRMVNFRLHRWNNALPASKSMRARIESVGLDVVLSVGQFIGMGAGITCWAIKR